MGLLLGTLCAELTFGSPLARRLELADEASSISRRLDDPATAVTVACLLQTPLSVPWLHDLRLRNSIEALQMAEPLADPGLLFRRARLPADDRHQGGRFRTRTAMPGEGEGVERAASRAGLALAPRSPRVDRCRDDGRTCPAESLADRALRIGMDTGQPDALPLYGAQMSLVIPAGSARRAAAPL